MEKEIIEGNKLIAEFMGFSLITPAMRKNPAALKYSYWERKTGDENDEHEGNEVLCEETKLIYHKSWDWQIPVWKELHQRIFRDCMQGATVDTKPYFSHCEGMRAAVLSNDCLGSFGELVSAIKWYTQPPLHENK